MVGKFDFRGREREVSFLMILQKIDLCLSIVSSTNYGLREW